MTTSIAINLGNTKVIYSKSMISTLLEDNILRVPGVEKLLEKASSDQNSELSSFLIYKHANGIDIQVFIKLLKRAQPLIVAVEVRDVVFYIFKKKLNISLKQVKVYIEDE